MAEQWIEASLALDLVGSSESILQRAHAGLISSRARSLLIDDDKHDDVEIPAKFWWAGAGKALDRDWSSGDFSTWIDHAEHWKTFGVTFGLAGLLEMLPFERRGVTARSLSVAGSPDWVTAKAARQFAYSEGSVNPAAAGSAILNQAKLGFLTARAVIAKGLDGGARVEPCHWEAREWDVPNWFWQNFTGHGTSSQVWENGMFAGRGTAPTGLRSMTLAGVHFLRASLEVLRPPSASRALTEQPTAKNTGGRPPAAFADELMCAIWASIYQGDFIPVRQAEIERHARLGGGERSRAWSNRRSG